MKHIETMDGTALFVLATIIVLSHTAGYMLGVYCSL